MQDTVAGMWKGDGDDGGDGGPGSGDGDGEDGGGDCGGDAGDVDEGDCGSVNRASSGLRTC